MDDNGYLTTNAIGHAAHEILQTETNANGCGNTSKGLFAVTDNKRILFISHQTFRGPFTININEKIPARQAISHDNTHLLLSPDQIRFSQSALEIRINPQTHIWFPMILNKLDFNLETFINRCKLIEREMISQLTNQESDFTSCLYRNIANQDQVQENQTNINNNLKSALYSRNKVAVNESLSNLLGCGEGLTPSGDDFICGFLLAAHAWNEILFPGFALQKTIGKIVDVAKEKTTTLSANLITCAASGSADERIIRCVEWLNSGNDSVALIMKELQSYGSSSGLDTLAGMLTFIQSSPIVNQ